MALCLVFGFICNHGLSHLRYGMCAGVGVSSVNIDESLQCYLSFTLGTDSCKWLLSDGRFNWNHEWQPYGCMMHKYSQMWVMNRPNWTIKRDYLRVLLILISIFVSLNLATVTRSDVFAIWCFGAAIIISYSSAMFVCVLCIRHSYVICSLWSANDPDDNQSHTFDYAEPLVNLEYVDNMLKLRVNYIRSADVSQPMINEFTKWQQADDPPSVYRCEGNAFTIFAWKHHRRHNQKLFDKFATFTVAHRCVGPTQSENISLTPFYR